MCGILGASSNFALSDIDAALRSIKHRGPDEDLILEDDGATFGFARLSIMEISAGKQPLHLKDQNLTALFNGEIYNYQELRMEMELAGIPFNSTSEVEVLLRGYRRWGKGFFPKLRGMYAIAFWDSSEKTLILVRDPLGKKPLYWFRGETGFGFASEIKALWCFIPFDRAHFDRQALVDYLVSDSVPTPRSIDDRIRKLKPGTILEIGNRGVSETSFWPSKISNGSAKKLEIADAFHLHLKQSVLRRLQSEVPVGIFLSSGLDSRAVASMVSKCMDQRIPSYTLQFSGTYDESEKAKEISRDYGFEHILVASTDEDLAEIWQVAKELGDEPLNDPAVLPMMLLSRAAGRSVKVAITGDGGDELFMGYPHFRLHRMPLVSSGPVSSVLKPLLKAWPDNGEYFGFGFRLQRLSRGLGVNGIPNRDLAWRGGFKWDSVRKFLRQDFLGNIKIEDSLKELRQEFFNSSFGNTNEARLSWWYFRTYLMDTVLVKVDRASMAFGVECRSPLLDIDLVEAVLNWRNEQTLTAFPRKKLLELSIVKNGFSPPTKGKKHGMGVPVVRLLKTVLKDEFNALTNLELIESQGIFAIDEVEKLRLQLHEGRQDIRKEAWAIFVFQAWMQKFGDKLGKSY